MQKLYYHDDENDICIHSVKDDAKGQGYETERACLDSVVYQCDDINDKCSSVLFNLKENKIDDFKYFARKKDCINKCNTKFLVETWARYNKIDNLFPNAKLPQLSQRIFRSLIGHYNSIKDMVETIKNKAFILTVLVNNQFSNKITYNQNKTAVLWSIKFVVSNKIFRLQDNYFSEYVSKTGDYKTMDYKKVAKYLLYEEAKGSFIEVEFSYRRGFLIWDESYNNTPFMKDILANVFLFGTNTLAFSIKISKGQYVDGPGSHLYRARYEILYLVRPVYKKNLLPNDWNVMYDLSRQDEKKYKLSWAWSSTIEKLSTVSAFNDKRNSKHTRILSWNINFGKNYKSESTIDDIFDFLAYSQADITCLQKIDDDMLKYSNTVISQDSNRIIIGPNVTAKALKPNNLKSGIVIRYEQDKLIVINASITSPVQQVPEIIKIASAYREGNNSVIITLSCNIPDYKDYDSNDFSNVTRFRYNNGLDELSTYKAFELLFSFNQNYFKDVFHSQGYRMPFSFFNGTRVDFIFISVGLGYSIINAQVAFVPFSTHLPLIIDIDI